MIKTKALCRFLQFGLFSMVAAVTQAETLETLIVQALQSNPELQSSRLFRDASGAQIDSARWQYFPTPVVSIQHAEVSSNDSSYVGDDYAASIGLVQPLWSGGAIKNNLSLAKANFEVNDADVALIQQRLALRVLSTYSDWLGATLRVEAWRESLLILQHLSDQVQRRTSGGASSESDLSLAEARTSLTEAELFSAIAQQQAALSGLTELVGAVFTTEALMGEQPQPLGIAEDQARLRALAPQISPGVLKAHLEVEHAEAERRVIRSEKLPSINLRVEHQYGDLTVADTDSSNRLFIEFTSRFGAGLSGMSDASAARYRRDAAVSNVNTQRRALDATLVSDFALKASIEQRLQALHQSKRATQAVYASFERQFLSGSRSWLDVLNSAREITQLDLQLADAEPSLILVTWRLSILTAGLNSVLTDSSEGVRH